MSLMLSALPARVLAGALGLVVIVLTYHLSTSQAGVANLVRLADRSISDPISNLKVSLKQMSSAPPVIQAIVTNKNSYPVTVVSYDSPLDSLALKLGLLSITPESSSSPLSLPVVQARRMWPPPADALVAIAPGESVVNDITVDGLGFDEKVLESVSRASVALIGNWHAVWPKDKESMVNIELGSVDPDPDVYSGPFASESLNIRIGGVWSGPRLSV
ncbi:hypothetical protein E4U55_006047 [Claviceps digitariae]|nr:hypothetical protein E4U55_006047 [Claviceps digitariae]